jgi:hypothetical protein
MLELTVRPNNRFERSRSRMLLGALRLALRAALEGRSMPRRHSR